MDVSEAELRTFEGLRRIVAHLRGPDGCPWDRAQTHASLKSYLLEEAAGFIPQTSRLLASASNRPL